MKLKKFCIGAMAAMIAMAVFAAPKCNVPITVSGYAGTKTLTDFPVLVRLSESISGFRYADCAADGRDIAFVDADGAAIPHEIDVWNTNGESLVWVKLPTMANGTTFTMTYKDAAATEPPSAEDTAATWSAYGMVWHMSEPSNTVANATAYGSAYDATPKGASAGVAVSDGVFGAGRKTSKANGSGVGYLSVPNYNALGYGGVFTMSGWMRVTKASTGCARAFSRKKSWTDYNGWEFELGKNSYTGYSARGASSGGPAGNLPNFQTTWVHVALVYNNGNLKVYGNGAQVGNATIATATDNGLELSIGCVPGGNCEVTCGDFDECRLRGGAMSADWVAAEYAQASAGFVTFGEAGSPGLTVRGDVGDYGTATPAWGRTSDYTEGETIVCSVTSPTITEDGNTKAVCMGWTYVDGDSNETSGSGNATTITYSIGSKLTWHFDLYNRFSVTSDHPEWGTVAYDEKAFDGTWVKRGGTCEVTATPTSDEYDFIGWTGDVDDAHKRDNPLTVVVTNTPMTVTAVFSPKYFSQTIDLTDGDATVTVLPGCICTVPEVIGNDAANLTIAGGGTLILPGADLSIAFATLTIDGVTVYAKDSSSLGAGGVLIRNNGGIVFSEAFTLANKITIESGSTGTITLTQDANFGALLVSTSATFIKRGAGKLTVTGASENTTWTIAEGALHLNGSFDSTHTLDIRENVKVTAAIDIFSITVGKIVMQGGSFEHALPLYDCGTDMIHPTTAHYTISTGTITVNPSQDGSESYISLGMISGSSMSTICVNEGAVLNLNSQLAPAGRGIRSLTKKGTGKLRLLDSPYSRGSINIEEGTLALHGRNVRIGKDVALHIAEGARIALENGATLDQVPGTVNVLLEEAGIWLDATRVNDYMQGKAIENTINLGTAGGVFSRSSPASGPNYNADIGNGKPAIDANTLNTSHGMGLICAGAYSNTGKEISTYMVVKPNVDKLTFADAIHGQNGGPFYMGNRSDSSAGGFRYEYTGTNSFNVYFSGNGGKMEIKDEPAVDINNGLFMSAAIRTATTASLRQYRGDDVAEYVQELTGQTFADFNIANVSIFAHQNYGSCWTGSEFPAALCELLVFSRALTATEDEAVRGYLAKKWFDSKKTWAELPNEKSSKVIPVEVAAGDIGYINLDKSETDMFFAIEKYGTGKLVDVSSTPNGMGIDVKEGTFAFATATRETCPAAIWFDAADTNAVETDGGGVVARVANKGYAGGVFTPQFADGEGSPTLSTMNGLSAVQFDGADDFLHTMAFTNSTPREFYVYVVKQRDGFKKWNAGGIFSYSQSTNTVADTEQAGAFIEHDGGEYAQTVNFDCGSVGYDRAFSATYDPVIDFCCLNDYRMYFGQVVSNTTDLTALTYMLNMHAKMPNAVDRTAMNDLFLIGARKNAKGKPANFWNGRIGEILLFEQPLNVTQTEELMAYLRKKWMNVGEGSATPPRWLDCLGKSVVTGGKVELVQKADTALVQDGPTVSLASLTMEEGATLARTTKCTGEALFNVTGKVTAEGSVNVALTPFPHGDQTLFKYGTADLSGDVAAWPALRKSGTATGLVHQDESENLIYICGPGLMFLVK